ncbi:MULTISPECIES: HEAT repeat domain-containing protein [unclassified Microcoleus]|uniref:HEAT repeat domain-containing protein n=1 Tax=unclassified Microcoleus TaxID=2642155 RepID=UPI002FD21067
MRKGDSAVALAMLLRKVNDGEFMVRFMAMGWRHSQTAEALAALLKMMQFDRDRNVPAEAANSLSMLGSEAIAHFVAAFRRDDNLLVRRCTMARLCDRLPPKIDCQNAILKIRK